MIIGRPVSPSISFPGRAGRELPELAFGPADIQDTFVRSEPALCGMPDPRKYPNWRPSRVDNGVADFEKAAKEQAREKAREALEKRIGEATAKDGNEGRLRVLREFAASLPKDPPGMCGGLDGPLFIDGKITSKRQMIAEGKADPFSYVAY